MTSGTAFCGVVGNERRREYTIMGDVVNLAARLMQAAAGGKTGTPVPGGVLCCIATHSAAVDRLAFEAVDPIQVKGKSQPVSIYRPLPKNRSPRTSAHTAINKRVVGREAEIAAIDAMLARLAISAKPQRMALIGDGDPIEKTTPYSTPH